MTSTGKPLQYVFLRTGIILSFPSFYFQGLAQSRISQKMEGRTMDRLCEAYGIAHLETCVLGAFSSGLVWRSKDSQT